MDSQFTATREDLYHVQMDVKHVQAIQNNHAERLMRLEKRQADDAALKSVWGPESPFPSVLSGTPQHGPYTSISLIEHGQADNVQGPIQSHAPDVFDDFDDEHGQNLLGSLQLEADEEPVRRGASRANSVRFDVSALQGSNWNNTQGSRSSGEFVPIRPTSGFGNHSMERSSSHKSDGRHSSTGQSIHSIHSLHSGRTSSLGLDTNFVVGGNEDGSPVIVPQPPPGLFVLGSVPSIIRCWLTTDYSHHTLLYAVVCTGSQKSVVEQSLVKELSLADQIWKDDNGRDTIRLPVYLPEAVITEPSSRSSSPTPQIPALTADFEVTGSFNRTNADSKRIRVCLGSDALRAHNADVLFSQNLMTLYSDDRKKLSVPFARPEDENLFKNLQTSYVSHEKNGLKATANPFTPGEKHAKPDLSNNAAMSRSTSEFDKPDKTIATESVSKPNSIAGPESPFVPGSTSSASSPYRMPGTMTGTSDLDRSDASGKQSSKDEAVHDFSLPEAAASADSKRRESSGAAWGSWRQGILSGSESSRDNEPTSGYQKATRTGKTMKVLKPSKSMGPAPGTSRSSSTVRTGASYEPPAPQRSLTDSRRKTQPNGGNENMPPRWESKHVTSEEQRSAPKAIASLPRSSNPIGGASAFAWMTSKPKTSTTTAE